jgi:adenine-specific DNA-methyltransferase
MGWRYDRKTMGRLIREGRVLWPANADGRPRRKAFFDELESEYTGFSTIIGEDIYTRHGTAEIDRLFSFRVFDFPKPPALISEFIVQGAGQDDIIMDFFSGSGSTAQSVLELNERDGGRRKFILVQLPEMLERGDYKTISEVTRERLRRLIRLLEKNNSKDSPSSRTTGPDRGFRSFRLSPSQFRDWAGVAAQSVDEYLAQMRGFGDPLFDGFDANEVIWEVAIKEGYPLTSRIESTSVHGHAVHRVTDPDTGRFFHICLDGEVKAAVVNTLNLRQDDLFVCRDIAIDDSIAANLALNCRLKTV